MSNLAQPVKSARWLLLGASSCPLGLWVPPQWGAATGTASHHEAQKLLERPSGPSVDSDGELQQTRLIGCGRVKLRCHAEHIDCHAEHPPPHPPPSHPLSPSPSCMGACWRTDTHTSIQRDKDARRSLWKSALNYGSIKEPLSQGRLQPQ